MPSKLTKAYLVNAKECTVTEIEIKEGIKDLQDKIGCDCFTVAPSHEKGYPDLFVDDEGLFADERYFFIYKGYPQPL